MSNSNSPESKEPWYIKLAHVLWEGQPKWLKGVWITASIFSVAVYFLVPIIAEHGADYFFERYTNPDVKDLHKIGNRERMKDSITQVKYDSVQKILSERNVRRRDQIQFRSFRLEKMMPHCIAVNFWSIHDGGETLDVDGRWYLEVYVSSKMANEEDFRNPPPIFSGFRWLGKELERKGTIYFEDVTKYPDLYINKAKDQLDNAGVKSFIGAYVKNNAGKEWLYVTFDFDVVDPIKKIPNLRYLINDFRRYVDERV